ncbi:hypothetical protein [Fusobacterium varium]|uniref:hypothetical protein n=1 Tax=Fusobacterium varium TaxID=856 RepID=UPI00266D60D9|nr:hypothetical protein [Fusobacterium varium]
MISVERIEKAIIETIKTKIFPNNSKFTYINGFIKPKEQDFSRRRNEEDEMDDYIPYILVRPNRIKIKEDKTIDFLVRIVIKEEESTGYYKLFGMSNEVINYFNKNYFTKDYQIKFDDIAGDWEEDSTVGDYWAYNIKLPVILPTADTGSLMRDRD